jgi:hypothetical protein
MRKLEKSGLSEPLIDCSPQEGILQITIFALVGAPSRGGAARLVVLDREPEQLIGSPFDSFSRFRAGAVRVARFVCSDSSAASASGGTSGSNAPTLSCCSEDPAGCAATRLGSYGANGLLPTEYGRGPVTEERGAFVPQKP